MQLQLVHHWASLQSLQGQETSRWNGNLHPPTYRAEKSCFTASPVPQALSTLFTSYLSLGVIQLVGSHPRPPTTALLRQAPVLAVDRQLMLIPQQTTTVRHVLWLCHVLHSMFCYRCTFSTEDYRCSWMWTMEGKMYIYSYITSRCEEEIWGTFEAWSRHTRASDSLHYLITQDENEEAKLADILTAVVDAISTRCNCSFTEDSVLDGVFQCFNSESNSVTFRGRLRGLAVTNSSTLAGYVTEWVATGAAILLQNSFFHLDSRCRDEVVIKDLLSPECAPTISTTGGVSPNSLSGSEIGGIVVVVITLMSSVLTLISVLLGIKIRRR